MDCPQVFFSVFIELKMNEIQMLKVASCGHFRLD